MPMGKWDAMELWQEPSPHLKATPWVGRGNAVSFSRPSPSYALPPSKYLQASCPWWRRKDSLSNQKIHVLSQELGGTGKQEIGFLHLHLVMELKGDALHTRCTLCIYLFPTHTGGPAALPSEVRPSDPRAGISRKQFIRLQLEAWGQMGQSWA